mgnify:CR=1 FL=1
MDKKLDQLKPETDVVRKAEVFLKEEVQPMDEELVLPKYNSNPRATPKQTTPLAKGGVLKKVREEKGLTLEMVQEATKIPMDSLRAIEEGYTVRTLSPFYYKGFVKIYSQYLGVDITEVLGSDYQVKESTAKLMRQMPIEEINFQSWYDKFLTRQRKRQIVFWSIALVVLFILFKIVTGIGSWIKEHFPKKKTAAVRVESIRKPEEKNKRNEPAVEIVVPKAESSRGKVEQEVVQVESGSQPLVEVMATSNSYASETPAEVVNKDIMITVRSKKNSWLRVKTDGETVFQTTLKQGVVESWSADENIEISGKNLAQLEIELNGKMIGNLARDGRLANTVVITKKGLSVIK